MKKAAPTAKFAEKADDAQAQTEQVISGRRCRPPSGLHAQR